MLIEHGYKLLVYALHAPYNRTMIESLNSWLA